MHDANVSGGMGSVKGKDICRKEDEIMEEYCSIGRVVSHVELSNVGRYQW